MIVIDGSRGEGGGQILRSSLALSMVTGKPFRIEKIRAGRKTPGLLRQHLTSVRAAAAVSGATVTGDELGSQRLEFTPGAIRAGAYHFAVGTAGSAMLVFQTVFPALMLADGPSEATFEGGTHNPMAPPFEFLERTFLPLVARIGAKALVELTRPGFFPAGSGSFTARVEPFGKRKKPLELDERGKIQHRNVTALVSHLPDAVGKRELETVAKKLSWAEDDFQIRRDDRSVGPGNALMIEVGSEQVTEIFTGFGDRNVRSEAVAEAALAEAKAYLAAEVAVGEHLADQLLIPMALGAGGRFTTLPPSRHTETNIETIRTFLDVDIQCEKVEGRVWRVTVTPR